MTSVVPCVSARHAPLSILSPSLTHDCAHVSLCWNGYAITRLRNTFLIAFSFRQLSFASLRGNCQLTSPPVRSCVCSARVVYHLQPDVSTVVCYESYHLFRPTPSSLCHPIISASLFCPFTSLVPLHPCRISTRRNCFHCPGIYVVRYPRRLCCPL